MVSWPSLSQYFLMTIRFAILSETGYCSNWQPNHTPSVQTSSIFIIYQNTSKPLVVSWCFSTSPSRPGPGSPLGVFQSAGSEDGGRLSGPREGGGFGSSGFADSFFYWSWCHPKNLMMYKCLCGMGVLSTRGCPPWGPVFIGTVDYIQYIVCQTGPSTFFLKGQHWYTPMPPRCACSLIKPSFSRILGVYIWICVCTLICTINIDKP